MIEAKPFFRRDGSRRDLTANDYANIAGVNRQRAIHALMSLVQAGIVTRGDTVSKAFVYSLVDGWGKPKADPAPPPPPEPDAIPLAYARAFQTLPLPIVEDAIGKHMLRHERAAGHRGKLPTMAPATERRLARLGC